VSDYVGRLCDRTGGYVGDDDDDDDDDDDANDYNLTFGVRTRV